MSCLVLNANLTAKPRQPDGLPVGQAVELDCWPLPGATGGELDSTGQLKGKWRVVVGQLAT